MILGGAFVSFCIFEILWIICFVPFATTKTVKIGALFEAGESALGAAFHIAIENFNAENKVFDKINLKGHLEYIPADKSFYASKIACKLIQEGVWLVIGSQKSSVAWHLSSMFSHFHIPYIQIYENGLKMGSGPVYKIESDGKSFKDALSLTLYPPSSLLNKAFQDLMEQNSHWKRITLVYETHKDFLAARGILETSWLSNGLSITTRKLDSNGKSLKKLLQDCKRRRENSFVISLQAEKTMQLMNEAKELGLVTEYNNYVLINMDVSNQDWHSFRWVHTNLTTFSLLDQWPLSGNTSASKADFGRAKPRLDVSLIYDAISLLGETLMHEKLTENGLEAIRPPLLDCLSNRFWSYGDHLIRRLRNTSVIGITGKISFDFSGLRSNLGLNLVKLKGDHFFKIGHWTVTHGLVPTGDQSHRALDKELRVNSILAVPFLMLRADHERFQGNEKFEGFVIDFLETLKAETNLSFSIALGKDAFPGYFNGGGTWNDVIRNLVMHRVDLAVGDMTITSEYEKVVDFTLPFMTFGIGLLTPKTQTESLDIFMFMRPFSPELWCCVGLAYVWVTSLLYMIGRFSPLERTFHLSSEYLHSTQQNICTRNDFRISNCAWFVLCSIFQQSNDLTLRAFSTRTLAVFWWFFSLIIVSFYTANFAAFLISSKLQEPIDNLEAFLRQDKIPFGCIKYSSTYNFLKNSDNINHRRIFNMMNSRKAAAYVRDNSEGIRKVLDGSYAFFMESSYIMYYTNRYCNLTHVGNVVSDRGYGVALASGSPHRETISRAILRLHESHQLRALRDRWFVNKPLKDRQVHLKRPDDDACTFLASSDSSELQIDRLLGLLVILLLGSAIGCMLALFELIWASNPSKDSFKYSQSKQISAFQWTVTSVDEEEKPKSMVRETVI